MFLGHFEIGIDAKNRIVIPTKWREAMGIEIVLTEGFEGALELRSKFEFQSYLEKINSQDSFSRHSRVLKRKILGGSHEITLDKWSRFVIPSSIQEVKKFKATILLVARGDCIEIWDKNEYEKWSLEEENSQERAAEAISNKKE